MFLSNITSMWTDIKYDWLAERFHCTHRGEYCPKTCDLFGPHPHLLFLPDTNTFTDRCTSAQCFLASWTHSAMVVRQALLSNTWRRKMMTKLTSSCLAQITKAATEMWMLFKFTVALTPSLPQPVKFPGWKMHGRGCKQHIFRSYDIYFQCMCFDADPFTCQCKKEDRNSKGFHILHFYWSFSSDIVAVKGLSTQRLYGL